MLCIITELNLLVKASNMKGFFALLRLQSVPISLWESNLFSVCPLQEERRNCKDRCLMITFWWTCAYKWVNAGSIRDKNSAEGHWCFLSDTFGMRNMYFPCLSHFIILIYCCPEMHCYSKTNIQLEESALLIIIRLFKILSLHFLFELLTFTGADLLCASLTAPRASYC